MLKRVHAAAIAALTCVLWSVTRASWPEVVRLTPPYADGTALSSVYSCSPDSSRVFYDVKSRDVPEGYGRIRLYSVAMEGGTPVEYRPAGTLHDTGDFAVSPDSTRVVYFYGTKLYSSPVQGGTAVELAGGMGSNGTIEDFQIFPDSREVLFRDDRDTNGVYELYRISITGGAVTKVNVALGSGEFILPSGFAYRFTPDGKRLVYAAGRSPIYLASLYDVPTSGGATIRLTPPLPSDRVIREYLISYDSKYVVFDGDLETKDMAELYSVPAAGGALVKLNGPLPPTGDVSGAIDTYCRISYDSLNVAYAARQDSPDTREIYIVPIGGGVSRKINGPLPEGHHVEGFAFSLDSNHIGYRAAPQDVVNLYAVPVAGGDAIQISALPPEYHGEVSISALSVEKDFVYYLGYDLDDSGRDLFKVRWSGAENVRVDCPIRYFTRFEFFPELGAMVFVGGTTGDAPRQIYELPIAGGMATLISLSPGEVSDCVFALDRRQIVYSAGNALYRTTLIAHPKLESAGDAGQGKAGVTWSDDNPTSPAQYLGFAYDVYDEQFVARGWEGTIWFPLPAETTSGTMDLGLTGGYHAWISSQYPDGSWFPCSNPMSLILYSGRPRAPAQAAVEDLGANQHRLHWKPDIYGTWLYQIIVHQDGADFIQTQGPDGFGLWHFIDYGGVAYDPAKASFLDGWADLTLPAGASCVLFLNGVAWDATTQGPFAAAASP